MHRAVLTLLVGLMLSLGGGVAFGSLAIEAQNAPDSFICANVEHVDDDKIRAAYRAEAIARGFKCKSWSLTRSYGQYDAKKLCEKNSVFTNFAEKRFIQQEIKKRGIDCSKQPIRINLLHEIHLRSGLHRLTSAM